MELNFVQLSWNKTSSSKLGRTQKALFKDSSSLFYFVALRPRCIQRDGEFHDKLLHFLHF